MESKSAQVVPIRLKAVKPKCQFGHVFVSTQIKGVLVCTRCRTTCGIIAK
jgi:hypothetical protein